jgi:hypothetical protein
MKSHPVFSTNPIASPSDHKAIESWSHHAKASGHRYERRKVREWLRHGGDSEWSPPGGIHNPLDSNSHP